MDARPRQSRLPFDAKPTPQETGRCPHCGANSFVADRCVKGPHFAKLVCEACWRFVKWLPSPHGRDAAAPPGLLERAGHRTRLAKLVGSAAQRKRAAAIRARLLDAADRAGEHDKVQILMAVADASFFIACDKKGWHWPNVHQLEAAPEGATHERH